MIPARWPWCGSDLLSPAWCLKADLSIRAAATGSTPTGRT
jgi:hypothetical protein